MHLAFNQLEVGSIPTASIAINKSEVNQMIRITERHIKRKSKFIVSKIKSRQKQIVN